jgi:hypothetical protein
MRVTLFYLTRRRVTGIRLSGEHVLDSSSAKK